MPKLSTEQVAKTLGVGKSTLSRYILAGRVPAPKETMAGGMRMRLWSEKDIQLLREILPKIANGRKTRYQKKQSALSNQQSAKTAKKKKTKK